MGKGASYRGGRFTKTSRQSVHFDVHSCVFPFPMEAMKSAKTKRSKMNTDTDQEVHPFFSSCSVFYSTVKIEILNYLEKGQRCPCLVAVTQRGKEREREGEKRTENRGSEREREKNHKHETKGME